MKGIPTLFACLSLLLLASSSTASAQTQLSTRTVVSGLRVPWEIIWGPDNWIWVTERSGRISRVNPESGEQRVLITIADVVEQTESGLLGMALHPNFADSPHVFVVYNYRESGSIREKLVRYTYDGAGLASPTILIQDITGNFAHDGSRLLILPDRTLMMTTGDALNTSSAQSWTSLNGKVLRMNLDGTAPADNPMAGAGFPANIIWSSGHRNPQGLTRSANGTIYTSMHGANSDDEINLVAAGRNYGWPTVQGACNTQTEQAFCNDSNVVEPIKAWSPTIAPAGIEYYNSSAIPEWRNSLLLTTLNVAGSDLRVLTLSSDGQQVTGETIVFDGAFGRLRDLCVAPDGRVFISTSNRDGRGTPRSGDDRIVEIRPAVASEATITTGEVGVGRSGPVHGGDQITVPFTISGTFNAGNVYTAQMSDSTGSFATPTTIGTLTGVSAGTVQAILPCSMPSGTRYRVRIVSSSPSVEGSANGIDIAVAPTPPPTITNSGNVLQASSAAAYQWNLNGTPIQGATAQSHTAIQSGAYTVAVVDTAGCSGVSEPFQVSVSSVRLVDESEVGLKLRPQPVLDRVMIEIRVPGESSLQLQVHDIHGNVLMTIDEGRIEGTYRRELSVGELPAGVYIVAVTSGPHVWRERFVRQ